MKVVCLACRSHYPSFSNEFSTCCNSRVYYAYLLIPLYGEKRSVLKYCIVHTAFHGFSSTDLKTNCRYILWTDITVVAAFFFRGSTVFCSSLFFCGCLQNKDVTQSLLVHYTMLSLLFLTKLI